MVTTAFYLFACFTSFLAHFFLIVPFIHFLYTLKFQRAQQQTVDAFDKPTPIFDKFNKKKHGVPVGGGILIVVLSTLLFGVFMFLYILFNDRMQSNYPAILAEIRIIVFAFMSFACLGLWDDLHKIFYWKETRFFGIRLRHKLIIEIVLGLIIATWLHFDLKINFIYIPFFTILDYEWLSFTVAMPWGEMITISWFYILFATFVIVSFANAVNITDGVDGLAGGVLLIALITFWIISRTLLDVPTSIFIAVWLGGLLAFLYFNVYPARIIMGDTGALSFGATFAVIGLILGKTFVLLIIGGIFVIEIASSFLQLAHKHYFHKKLFPVAPVHLWLQLKGWEEPKVTMRIWVISIVFSIVGLMIAALDIG